jgi:hypothetical protein
MVTRGISGKFNLAKEDLTTEEANKLFLVTDNEGRMVWQVVALCVQVYSLQTIWN